MNEEQRRQWKAVLDAKAAHHQQQRNRRGRRTTGITTVRGPGMVRLLPERAQGRTKPRGKTP